MKSFFTDPQWGWIAERHREGYTQEALARFLGVHRETVRRGLIRYGALIAHQDELAPLADLRTEFIRLGRMRSDGE